MALIHALYILAAVVTNVLVASVNATSVIVSWDRIDIMEITSYTVYYSAIGSMNDELNVTVPSSQNSVVIGNLQSGVEYRFVVDAVAMLSRVGNIRGQRSGISHPSASMYNLVTSEQAIGIIKAN